MHSRFKLVVVTFSTLLVAMLLAGAVVGRSSSPDDAYKHLAVYSEVLSRIKSEYVEEPDIKNVTLGAINGLLESIDPYASYLNAEQYKQYLKSQDAKKASVGLVLSKKFGYVSVVDAIPGGPGSKAGLNTGDLIESISGVATRDMPLAFAELLMEGEPGSTLEMSVLRLRKPEPQKISLTRANIKFPGVVSKMLPEQVGMVQVQSFEHGKLKDVTTALEQLSKQGAKKFLLDLRNSSVGKPEDGMALANLFVDKGLLSYLQGQKVARQDFNADSSKAQFKQPLVVLTNRGTAAAAEVAAAALLDNKRAEIVGERTYGDASMRRAITMDDGAAVILSVAKYYSPAGKAIQDTGVTPTYLVTDFESAAEPDDDSVDKPEAPKQPETDTIMKRGIELLTKGKVDTAAAAPNAAKPADNSRENGDTPTTVKPEKEKK